MPARRPASGPSRRPATARGAPPVSAAECDGWHLTTQSKPEQRRVQRKLRRIAEAQGEGEGGEAA